MTKNLIKKICVIFVCLIFFVNSSNAATPFTYLSCKAIVEENKTEDGVFKDHDKLKSGSNIGYYFYKFKETKKKSKVMIHEQSFLSAGDWDWRGKKPEKYTKQSVKWDDYSDQDNIYTFVDRVKSGNFVLTMAFAVQKINDQYHNTVTFSQFENNVSQLDIVMDQTCEKINKSEYKDLLKKGIN